MRPEEPEILVAYLQMHQYFPDLVPADEERVRKIFQASAISLDTNVVLTPYREGESERTAWFEWIEQPEIASRLFIPFQVQQEVLNNRGSMINSWSSAYSSMITKVKADVRRAKEELRKDFPPRRYPHIRYLDIDAAFDQAAEEIGQQVEAERTRRTLQQVSDPDPIYERLQELISDRTALPFTEDERQKVYTEGRERYKRNIPPGYEDGKDKQEPRRYGDLLIWEELIKEAKEKQKPFVFVTNDMKADWFEQTTPRRSRWELHVEFFQKTGQVILIWPQERFQREAHKYLDIREYEVPTEERLALEPSPLPTTRVEGAPPSLGGEMPYIDGDSGSRDENGVLLTQVLPSGPVQLTCFVFRYAETGRLTLDPTGRRISFDPSTLSEAERLAFTQWGTAILGLVATLGSDQHQLIDAYGTANGDYQGEPFRAWLIPDHYNNSSEEFFPTALIRL